MKRRHQSESSPLTWVVHRELLGGLGPIRKLPLFSADVVSVWCNSICRTLKKASRSDEFVIHSAAISGRVSGARTG